MYSGSTEFNNLIEKSGGNALKSRLIFSDFTLENLKKLEYHGGSNNSDDIAIGTTNMAYLDVSAITDKIITNQEFLLEVGMELSDGTIEYAPMGYFTVQKPSRDDDTTDFMAYDRMQKFEKPYFSALTYPTDSAKVLNELCTLCGVELATPIANPITITDNLEGYTCREVLGYIAGIHDYFACIDRYGKLNLRWYSETPVEKQIGLIWSLTKSQDDYTVEKITLAKDSETTYTSGDGISGINHSNPYATQTIADSIYTSLGGFTYRVCEISMLDDIRLDPWDMVQVTYFDGSVLKIPVMSLEHSFTNGETKIKSFGKTDTENEYSYSGPVTQAMDRMSTELLVANRIIATKVDAEWVRANTVTADELEATNARVGTLEANALTAETADLRYADIELANIDMANIGAFYANSGLLKDVSIVEGHITGELDAVRINADVITSGTLAVERLLITGKDSIIYQINVESSGLTTEELSDEKYQKYLNGTDIVANSITANQLNVEKIFSDEVVTSTLFAQDIEATGTIKGLTLESLNASIERGHIGGFEITKDALQYEDWMSTIGWTYDKVYYYSFGIKPGIGKVIYAGGRPVILTGGTYDEVTQKYWVNPDNMEYPFYVRNDGYAFLSSGKIGGFDIDDAGLSAVANVWVYPTADDFYLIREQMQTSEDLLTDNQKKAFDFFADGIIDQYDFLATRALLLGTKDLNYFIDEKGYTPTYSDILIKLDLNNADKVLSMSGTSSFESAVDYYFGVNKARFPKTTIAGELTTDYDIHSKGDVIANYGGDDEVSLLGLSSSKQNTITGAASSVVTNNFTYKSAAVYSDSNGKLASSSTVSSTELGYLDGVTSKIQTQLNAKQASVTYGGNTANGYINIPGIKIRIAWKRVSWTGPIDTAWGSGYENSSPISLGNWAAAFSAAPAVTYSAFASSQNADTGVNCYAPPSTTSAGSVYLQRNTAYSTSVTYVITAIAIGTYS